MHAHKHTHSVPHPLIHSRFSTRLCVVFDGVPSLLAYLEALIADPEVAVLRVKNRLDPVYHPRATAGFRSAPETHLFFVLDALDLTIQVQQGSFLWLKVTNIQ
jgi:hypothetical protein